MLTISLYFFLTILLHGSRCRVEELQAEIREAQNLKSRVEELEDELDAASGEVEAARAAASKAGEDSARAKADVVSLKTAAVR